MNDTTTESKEIVTPEQAQAWLSKNPNNRNINLKHVERLAKDMREGVFVYNGDPIRFDKSGDLMDGQHRLSAILMSGLPQQVLVVRGVDRSAMRTIDRGEARTVADWLRIRNFSNNTTCAHAAHMLHAFETGTLHQARGKFHPSDADSVLSRHPELILSVPFAISLRSTMRNIYNSAGTIAFLHYTFSCVDAEKADDFFRKLDKINLNEDGPISVLWRRLNESHEDKRKKLLPVAKMAFVLKAWSAFYKGRMIKRLQYGDDEDFPLVEGFRYDGNKPIFPTTL